MNNNRVDHCAVLIFAAIFVFACQPKTESGAPSAQSAYQTSVQHPSIVVKNSSDEGFQNVPLVLSREALTSILDGLQDANNLRLTGSGIALNQQFDDLDGDGRWDEIAFLIDVAAKETLVLTFQEVESIRQSYSTSTNVRIGQYSSIEQDGDPVDKQSISRLTENVGDGFSRMFQMEGPAWENENVGFRLYFDERNGLDIFGKTTREMVLDKVGIGHNYHELQPWGMDILKVGRSLGAGALAVANKTDDETTLHRVSNAAKTSVDIVAEGPVRSVIRVVYEELPVAENTINLTQEISIWSSQHFYESTLSLSQSDKSIMFAAGLANFFDVSVEQNKSASEPYIMTFGKQAELDTNLGMGLVIQSKSFQDFGRVGKTKEGIEQSEFAVFNVSPSSQAKYKVYAVWESGHTNFSNLEAFKKLVDRDLQRGQSVTVKVALP